MPATEVRARLDQRVFSEYFKFCVERNPWDKFLSFYWMVKQRQYSNLTIDEFLDFEDIGLNYPLYTDPTQHLVLVDRIIRYEDLVLGLDEIFNNLGIVWNGDLNYRAKGEYRKDLRHYREVLSERQAQIIYDRFKVEIDLHGYEY